MGGTMIKGQLPIVLTAAQQITADPVAIQAIVWYPSSSTDSVNLYDNQDNPVFIGKATTALKPIVLVFPCPISCQGLSLKQISGSNTLLVYPAAI